MAIPDPPRHPIYNRFGRRGHRKPHRVYRRGGLCIKASGRSPGGLPAGCISCRLGPSEWHTGAFGLRTGGRGGGGAGRRPEAPGVGGVSAKASHHRPDHFRMPDIAVGSAELRLIGLDDGVGVEQVELAWLEAELCPLRRERDLDPARWRLLVAVVAHASPLVGRSAAVFGVRWASMLAAGYHQPTARSAALNVHSSGPLTLWMKPNSAPGPRTSGSGTGAAYAKWENAPWIRRRVLTGLFAVPVAVGGRPGQRVGRAGRRAVPHQVDADPGVGRGEFPRASARGRFAR